MSLTGHCLCGAVTITVAGAHDPRPGACAVCGSHLWMRDNTGKTYDLMPGLFDEARDWPLRSEVYSDRAMASVRLGGDHRRATQAEYETKNQYVAGDAP